MCQYGDFVADIEKMLRQRQAVVLLQNDGMVNTPNALLTPLSGGAIEVSYGDDQEDMRATVMVHTVDEALDRLTHALPGWEWEAMQ
jgi:hypothetical protein